MLSGEPYNGADPALFEIKKTAIANKAVVDAIPADDMAARATAMAGLFGAVAGPCVVVPPFTVEFGIHIRLGEWVFINSGATFLDANTITIGDRTAVGPNVQFLTSTHPIKPEERFIDAAADAFPPFEVTTMAHPITLGRNVWIGAGVIIMPGVTIGDATVVGAGSVVTRPPPPRVIAVGSPARITRSIDD